MEAFQNAAFLCEEYYDSAPEIEIKGNSKFSHYFGDIVFLGQTMVKNAKGKKVGLSLVYPPPHLYHILFELFKNSMRATVETHGKSKNLPEIEVLVAKGEHDVSIRVSDQVLHNTLEVIYMDRDIFITGRRNTSPHHGSHVPLSLLHCSPPIHDPYQSTLSWLWIWAATL
jgi:hypothetical protein